MGLVFPIYASFFVNFKSPSMRLFFIAGCIAAGIFVGFFGFFITRMTIIRTLRELNRQMQTIVQGSSDLTASIRLESDDIIGKTISLFNKLIGVLAETFGEAKYSIFNFLEQSLLLNKAIEDGNSRIDKNTEELTLAAQDIAAQNGLVSIVRNSNELVTKAAGNTRQSLGELKHEVERIGEQLKSQERTIDAIVDNMKQLTDDSAIIRKNADDTARSVEGFVRLLETVLAEVRATSTTVTSVLQSLAGIYDLSESIADISRSTNILAMNAAIEASKVGKAGSGFTVVATEIRKLSSRTADAVGNTRTLLDTVNLRVQDFSKSLLSVTSLAERFQSETGVVLVRAGEIRNKTLGQNSATVKVLSETERLRTVAEQADVFFQKMLTAYNQVDAMSGEMSGSLDGSRSAVERVAAANDRVMERMSTIRAMNDSIRASQRGINESSVSCIEQVNKLERMIMNYRTSRKRIGEVLIEQSVITQEDLSSAIRIQSNYEGKKRMIGEILVELGVLSYDTLLHFLKQQQRK